MKKYILLVALFISFFFISPQTYAACGSISQSSPLLCNTPNGNAAGEACSLRITPGSPCCTTFAECTAPAGGSCTPGSCPDGQFCHPTQLICKQLTESEVPKPPFNVNRGPTNETFDAVNPLQISQSEYADDLSTPGGILSRVLTFAFPIAGMILFVMIVWGGFEILAGANEKKSLDSGKQRVTAAIVGYLLLFCAYWVAQIVEYIFGIAIV